MKSIKLVITFLIILASSVILTTCDLFALKQRLNPHDPLSYSYIENSLTENLVAYYKFDDISGTTAVEELGDYNGTINGALYTSFGKINGCYDFNGSSDNMIVSDALAELRFDSNQDHSFSFWLKLESTGVLQSLITRRASNQGHQVYKVYIGTDDKIHSNVVYDSGGNSLLTGSTALLTGIWYHVVIINDFGGTRYIYLDDTVDASISLTGFNIGGGTLEVNPIYFGSNYLINEFLDGQMDEIGIWDKALTSEEVNCLYNSGIGLTYPFVE